MRRSKSVLGSKNFNNQNQLENNDEQNQTGKITTMDLNKLYGKTPFSRKLKK